MCNWHHKQLCISEKSSFKKVSEKGGKNVIKEM